MFLVQRVLVRKSPDVPFYEWPEEYKNHFIEKYQATNKSPSSTIAKSADNLSLIVTSVWENKEAFEEFINDPVVVEHMYLRNKYNLDHGIEANIPSKTEL